MAGVWATISKEVQFDAGHRVPGHRSKCRNPHGHRYRVIARCVGRIVDDPERPDDGMLIDFGDLKRLLTEVAHDRFDHAMIVHVDDHRLRDALDGNGWNVVVVDLVPTAENLARMIYADLAERVDGRFGDDLRLAAVTVWETPTSEATYEPGPNGGAS